MARHYESPWAAFRLTTFLFRHQAVEHFEHRIGNRLAQCGPAFFNSSFIHITRSQCQRGSLGPDNLLGTLDGPKGKIASRGYFDRFHVTFHFGEGPQ